MKKTTQLFTALICFALGGASVHAGLSYWDSNGATAGAGTAPTGTWDADAFWSTVAGGTAATAAWASGDTAVFSAGTDATDLFTVTVNGDVQPARITFEEGAPTISGGSITMNAADFPIIAHTNATISSALEGSGFGFKKTGTGTLTLSGTSFHDGTDTVGEGVVAITSASALGSTLAPTIVSNGASLRVSAAGAGEPVILNGSGVNNSGAFRDALTGAGSYAGQVTLGSDARIEHSGSGNFTFGGLFLDGTNNANGFANLTIGGDGSGFHRFNISGPAIRLGSGVLIKEGLCQHNFEVPNDIGGIYFNRGHLNWRASGGGGTGVVYVAASAGQIRCTGANVTLNNNVVLASGADSEVSVGTGPLTFTGIISGPGSLSKTNINAANLNSANTYQGNTTIKFGTLALGASGSIANSAAIDVWSGGTFDVSLVSGGFVLGAAQTLKGNGTVLGNVTASGTMAPGVPQSGIGSLTNAGNLTLAVGVKLLIDVDKSLAPAANDMITATGTLNNTGAGTVTVTNLNPGLPLAPGDSFQLFDKALVNGGALTVVSAEGGVVWNNQLAVNGSIVVVSVSAPLVIQNPQITSIVGAGTTSVTVNYTNTLPGTNYVLQYRTNLNTTNWINLSPVPAGGTTSSATDTPPASSLHRYYRVYYVAQ